MNRNLGVRAIWVGGKLSIEGMGLFDKIYACNLVCGLELAFPYQKFHENCMFPHFLAENQYLPIICVYFQFFQNFEVVLSL